VGAPSQQRPEPARPRHALQIDAENAEAMVGIALIDTRDYLFGWGGHPDPTLTSQLDLVTKALTTAWAIT